MKETVSANKKLQREDALELLAKAKKVLIAKGKKVEEYNPKKVDHDEIVEDMLGRTGNLRAPVMVAKGVLYVGFPKDGFDALK